MSLKRNSSVELCPDRVFAARKVVWAISASDRCCDIDAVAYLGLPLRTEWVDVDAPPHSPAAAVVVVGVDLETEGNLDLSDILPSGSMDVCSSLRAVFSLIQEKLANIRSMFRLMGLLYSIWRCAV